MPPGLPPRPNSHCPIRRTNAKANAVLAPLQSPHRVKSTGCLHQGKNDQPGQLLARDSRQSRSTSSLVIPSAGKLHSMNKSASATTFLVPQPVCDRNDSPPPTSEAITSPGTPRQSNPLVPSNSCEQFGVQRAVYERMATMLSHMQDQCLEKLSLIAREAGESLSPQVCTPVKESITMSASSTPSTVDTVSATPAAAKTVAAAAAAAAAAATAAVAAASAPPVAGTIEAQASGNEGWQCKLSLSEDVLESEPEATESLLRLKGAHAAAANSVSQQSHERMKAERIKASQGGDTDTVGDDDVLDDDSDEDVDTELREETEAEAENQEANMPRRVQRAPAVSKVQKEAAGKNMKRPKKTKRKHGIQCLKTVKFEGCSAVRCAITVGDEVWTADWSGKLAVRDRENIVKLKDELPSAGIIWAMAFVEEPIPMIWVGQENTGIPVFHAGTRQLLCTLTGGHSGSVVALTVGKNGDHEMDVWSASNDFSVRCWHVGTGKNKPATIPIPGHPQCYVRRGLALYGHVNGVRSLLRIGPLLWSGSDDRSIRIWKCDDGECKEVVQEAHDQGVHCLIVAGAGIWSSGYEGVVKEWSLGGSSRTCLRQLDLQEPIRQLLPVGQHVWVCGKSKNIAIYSNNMTCIESLKGHESFVSSLLLVDRIEHRTVWSSSLGDHSVRVWHHVLRGEGASHAELSAANKLYQEEHQVCINKLDDSQAANDRVQAELSKASELFAIQLEEAVGRAAKAEQDRENADDERSKEAARRADVEKALADSQEKQTHTEQELASALAAKSAIEQEAQQAYTALAAAEAEITELQTNLDSMQRQFDDCNLSLSQERDRCRDLEKQLSAANARRKEDEDSAAQLRQLLREGENDQQEMRDAYMKLADAFAKLEGEARALREELHGSEQRCEDACAREKQLQLQYAELDIFKLDLIARELKAIDKQVDSIRSETRFFLESAKKFVNIGDQQTSMRFGMTSVDAATRVRGQVRDVIEKCLTEAQKLHVGAPIQDPTAAGVLKDGGSMGRYVSETPPEKVTPPHSRQKTPGKATPPRSRQQTPEKAKPPHPRQQDEVRRQRRHDP